MLDTRGEIRRILYRSMVLEMKTEKQAEIAIRDSVLALGLPFVLAQATFLPGRGRYAETVVLFDGQPLHVELLAALPIFVRIAVDQHIDFGNGWKSQHRYERRKRCRT